MSPSIQPYSSYEVAQMIDRWQFCRFYDLKTQKDIIALAHHDLYRSPSQIRCSPQALENIKTALAQAYNDGVREVGMLCPPLLRAELVDIALSVTKDPEWKIYPQFEFTYLKNLIEIQGKIEVEAELKVQLENTEKLLCDNWGFTEEVLQELLLYLDKDFENLPEHLQKLFSEWEEK